MSKDDDIRWMLAMLIDSGARVSEIAGLALDDIHTESHPPYLEIVDRPWRTLKTPASARKVPLIGAALWAAERIRCNSLRDQKVAFPRYVRSGKLQHSAKGTLGSWLSLRDFGANPTAIRRTFVDRLRMAGCPEDVRASIVGWRLVGMEEEYGIGFNIQTLHRWMLPITGSHQIVSDVNLTTGVERKLSLYECGIAVMKLVGALPYPSLMEMVRAGRIERPDIVRGLRYAKRHGCIALEEGANRARSPAYRLTGVALPSGPYAVRPRQRRMAGAPHYDHRKLLLSLPWPSRVQAAPTPQLEFLFEGLKVTGRRSSHRIQQLSRHDNQDTK
ncbi:hypothetical protein [Cupriavidus sp. H18C2]|uniref:hypothetical protein n=1 Tax=Cupriavidus sp. H18C2 TaxID=3241602 RepID=UPI003BF79B51